MSTRPRWKPPAGAPVAPESAAGLVAVRLRVLDLGNLAGERINQLLLLLQLLLQLLVLLQQQLELFAGDGRVVGAKPPRASRKIMAAQPPRALWFSMSLSCPSLSN